MLNIKFLKLHSYFNKFIATIIFLFILIIVSSSDIIGCSCVYLISNSKEHLLTETSIARIRINKLPITGREIDNVEYIYQKVDARIIEGITANAGDVFSTVELFYTLENNFLEEADEVCDCRVKISNKALDLEREYLAFWSTDGDFNKLVAIYEISDEMVNTEISNTFDNLSEYSYESVSEHLALELAKYGEKRLAHQGITFQEEVLKERDLEIQKLRNEVSEFKEVILLLFGLIFTNLFLLILFYLKIRRKV